MRRGRYALVYSMLRTRRWQEIWSSVVASLGPWGIQRANDFSFTGCHGIGCLSSATPVVIIYRVICFTDRVVASEGRC